MCGTCGCSDERLPASTPDVKPSEMGHTHHVESSDVTPSDTERQIRLEAAVLAKNDALAADNRAWFDARGLLALNFVSSPGSGKTTLIERMTQDLSHQQPVFVIQGDQATDRDAERVRKMGATALQVNTGTGCHLDAAMVRRACQELSPPRGALMAIENVGNLVCPALFFLGEHARVALMSTPEGADKPLKYPYMFRGSDLVLLNKIDLLPYVDFDVAFFRDCVSRVNASAAVLEISATRALGLSELYAWLRAQAPRPAPPAEAPA